MEVKASSPGGAQRQTVLVVVLIAVVVGGGVYWYMNQPSSSAVVQEAPTGAGTALAGDPQAEEIIAAIELLKRINLDTEFFNDERFAALRLTPVDIPPVQPVRQTVLKFRTLK